MREIKFRVWDTKNEIFTNYMILDDLIKYFNKHTGAWIIDKDNSRFKLMQYTGLKDNNGVEIFEGDIIQNTYNFDGEIAYDLVSVIFENGMFKTKEFDYSLAEFIGKSEDVKSEVIGNIYENKELLK